jgi:hypothetical protein
MLRISSRVYAMRPVYSRQPARTEIQLQSDSTFWPVTRRDRLKRRHQMKTTYTQEQLDEIQLTQEQRNLTRKSAV